MNRQQKIDSFFKKTPKRNSLPSPQTVINDTKPDSDKNDNPKVPSTRMEAITLSSDEEDMKASVKTVPTFIIARVSQTLARYHTSYGHLNFRISERISCLGYEFFVRLVETLRKASDSEHEKSVTTVLELSTDESVPANEIPSTEEVANNPTSPQNKSESNPNNQNEPTKSSVNEPKETESSQNQPKVREFSIACLDQVSTLLQIAKKQNLENNIEAVQEKYYEKRKVPYLEDSWFYFNCDEKCDPDCEGK